MAFRNTLVSLIMTFYPGYIGYIIFSAVGPKYTLAEFLAARLQANTITGRIDFVLNFEIF